jgi:hypothetical protein
MAGMPPTTQLSSASPCCQGKSAHMCTIVIQIVSIVLVCDSMSVTLSRQAQRCNDTGYGRMLRGPVAHILYSHLSINDRPRSWLVVVVSETAGCTAQAPSPGATYPQHVG